MCFYCSLSVDTIGKTLFHRDFSDYAGWDLCSPKKKKLRILNRKTKIKNYMRAMGHGEKNYAYLTQKTKMKNIHEIHGPWRKELCIFNRKIKIKNFMRAMGHIKNISFSYIFFHFRIHIWV